MKVNISESNDQLVIECGEMVITVEKKVQQPASQHSSMLSGGEPLAQQALWNSPRLTESEPLDQQALWNSPRLTESKPLAQRTLGNSPSLTAAEQNLVRRLARLANGKVRSFESMPKSLRDDVRRAKIKVALCNIGVVVRVDMLKQTVIISKIS